LVEGQRNEIRSKFIDTDKEFKSRSVEIGAIGIEGEIGGAHCMSERMKIYVSGNAEGGSKYRNLYGNIGLKYSF
jgi:hypothetical protein